MRRTMQCRVYFGAARPADGYVGRLFCAGFPGAAFWPEGWPGTQMIRRAGGQASGRGWSGLRARLADRHIALQLTEAARENLVATGYDPHYGARPLKRAIQKKVETPLGRLLLQGTVRVGQTVVVEADGKTGDLRFVAEPVAAR